MDGLLSVTEYADKVHKDPGNVRRMLASGRLAGYKLGNQWVIPAGSSYPKDRREKTGVYKNWRRKVQFNSNKELKKEIDSLVGDLRDIYSDKLDQIILYGSYARNHQTDESDVDVAIILTSPGSKEEIRRMYEEVAKHELSCGITLSVVDIDYKRYSEWATCLPFYRSIAREGIVLWTAN